MKIIPNQDFRHGAETYKQGQEYDVSDEDAEYFETAGWVGEPVETEQVYALDIQDGQLGQASEFSN